MCMYVVCVCDSTVLRVMDTKQSNFVFLLADTNLPKRKLRSKTEAGCSSKSSVSLHVSMGEPDKSRQLQVLVGAGLGEVWALWLPSRPWSQDLCSGGRDQKHSSVDNKRTGQAGRSGV